MARFTAAVLVARRGRQHCGQRDLAGVYPAATPRIYAAVMRKGAAIRRLGVTTAAELATAARPRP